MTNEFTKLEEALIQHGLNKQTAKGQQARAVIDALSVLSEEEKQAVVKARLDDLYAEAEQLVESMRDLLKKYDKLAGITDQLGNPDCKDALIMWREMLGFYFNYAHGADPAAAANAISYILFAIFGGQARGNVRDLKFDVEEF